MAAKYPDMGDLSLRTAEKMGLNCPVCLEVYKEPKSLACLHTFCETCIHSYVMKMKDNGTLKDGIECPLCRKTTLTEIKDSPPEEWTASLPNNYAILSVLDAVNSGEEVEHSSQNTVSCQPCQKINVTKTATMYCSNCREYQCAECANSHERFTIMKGHDIVEVSTNKSLNYSIGFGKLNQCDDHSKSIEYYCVDERKLCCSSCAIITHRKCKCVVEIQEMTTHADNKNANALKSKLTELTEKVKLALNHFQKSDKEIEEQISELPDQFETLRAKFDKMFYDLKQKVLHEATVLKKHKSTDLNETYKECEGLIAALEASLCTQENVVNHGTSSQLFIVTHKNAEQMSLYEKKAEKYFTKLQSFKINLHVGEHIEEIFESGKEAGSLSVISTKESIYSILEHQSVKRDLDVKLSEKKVHHDQSGDIRGDMYNNVSDLRGVHKNESRDSISMNDQHRRDNNQHSRNHSQERDMSTSRERCGNEVVQSENLLEPKDNWQSQHKINHSQESDMSIYRERCENDVVQSETLSKSKDNWQNQHNINHSQENDGSNSRERCGNDVVQSETLSESKDNWQNQHQINHSQESQGSNISPNLGQWSPDKKQKQDNKTSSNQEILSESQDNWQSQHRRHHSEKYDMSNSRKRCRNEGDLSGYQGNWQSQESNRSQNQDDESWSPDKRQNQEKCNFLNQETQSGPQGNCQIEGNNISPNQEIQTQSPKSYQAPNQNSSRTMVYDDLIPITSASDAPTVIHGTYYDLWELIKKTGLRRMNGYLIPFADGEPRENEIICGMGSTCDVIIFIDMKKALKDGVTFFRTASNLILSPGDGDGCIYPCYFDRVLDRRLRCKLPVLPFDSIISSESPDSHTPMHTDIRAENTDQEALEISRKGNNTEKEVKVCWNDPEVVKDVEQSILVVDHITSTTPEFIVVCCCGEELGTTNSRIRLLVVMAQPDVYIYHLHDDQQNLVKDGRLNKLLMDSKIHKIFHNIHETSTSLIREYDILLDGTPIWDIAIMYNKCKGQISRADKGELAEMNFSPKVFENWMSENEEYGKKLCGVGLDADVQQVMVARGKLMLLLFTICFRMKDDSQLTHLKYEIYGAAIPKSGYLADKIKELKLEKKKMGKADYSSAAGTSEATNTVTGLTSEKKSKGKYKNKGKKKK